MPKHPGLQHDMRLKECAELVNTVASSARRARYDLERAEAEIAHLKELKLHYDLTLMEVHLLRDWLEAGAIDLRMNCDGLPVPFSEEQWRNILREIRERKVDGNFLI